MNSRLKWSLLCLGLLLTSCRPSAEPDDVPGRYVGWMFMDGKYVPLDGKDVGTSDLLELRPNGTYLWEQQTRVMMIAHIKAEGKYKFDTKFVELSGTATSDIDDGYKKEKSTKPHVVRLKRENGMLVQIDAKDDPFYFRKENTGPPPVPEQLRLGPSDPAAVELLSKVQKKYASLDAYQDTGTVTSQGKGFLAKSTTFRTWFKRSKGLRFESFSPANPEGGWVEVTWDRKKTWWFDKEYGATTDRTLGNALGIVAVTHGDSALLIPSLLLPKELMFEPAPEVTRLADARIDGKTCAVLKLRNEGDSSTTLTIDLATLMILRATENIREGVLEYKPAPNAAFPDPALALNRRTHKN